MRGSVLVVVGLGLGWLLSVGLSVLLEPMLLFPAPRVDRPALYRLAQAQGATELEVVAEDGVRLYGWRAGTGARLLLLFSGNGATVGSCPNRLRLLNGAGFEVLHVNYRGYPGSEGRPSEPGLILDAMAAWEEALRSHAPEEIVLYGRSLGGGVAAGLVERLDEDGRPGPGKLVLESTFTSVVEVGAQAYRWLPVKMLMRNRFESLPRLEGRTLPTLILHGTMDELVPVGHGRGLARAMPASTLLEREGTHNDDHLLSEEGWAAFLGFVGESASLAPGPSPRIADPAEP